MITILTPEKRQKLVRELAEVVNKNSMGNESNTPDLILGEYLLNCLTVFNAATVKRDKYYYNLAKKIDD